MLASYTLLLVLGGNIFNVLSLKLFLTLFDDIMSTLRKVNHDSVTKQVSNLLDRKTLRLGDEEIDDDCTDDA